MVPRGEVTCSRPRDYKGQEPGFELLDQDLREISHDEGSEELCMVWMLQPWACPEMVCEPWWGSQG